MANRSISFPELIGRTGKSADGDRGSQTPTVVRDEIETRLAETEQTRSVRILFAVESGSRAWGFASPDSDYDVRFVYVHDLDWYLSLEKQRDIIELPIEDELDITGWELRKALNLLAGANPVMNEWLQSPIRYRWNDGACDDLIALSRRTRFLQASSHHYRSLGWRQIEKFLPADQAEVPLKRYFYAVRPAMALQWLSIHAEIIPPMNLQQMMAGLKETGCAWTDRDPAFNVPFGEIEDLIAQKANTKELGNGSRLPEIDRYLDVWLGPKPPVVPKAEKDPALLIDAKRVFRRLVLDRHP